MDDPPEGTRKRATQHALPARMKQRVEDVAQRKQDQAGAEHREEQSHCLDLSKSLFVTSFPQQLTPKPSTRSASSLRQPDVLHHRHVNPVQPLASRGGTRGRQLS